MRNSGRVITFIKILSPLLYKGDEELETIKKEIEEVWKFCKHIKPDKPFLGEDGLPT